MLIDLISCRLTDTGGTKEAGRGCAQTSRGLGSNPGLCGRREEACRTGTAEEDDRGSSSDDGGRINICDRA